MLKEITLPPIDMKKFSDQTIDSNLIIMSHDFNVNELVIPFYETTVFDTYEAFYSFQGNTSIIIQEVYNNNNEIRIPIVNDVRRHKGIFTIELNASSASTKATLLKLNVMVRRSNIDSNSEFLFNHYYKLFEDYEKELEDLKNGLQTTVKAQVKQAQKSLQEVAKTLILVNDTADGFIPDVVTKQADVTSKYNAFDTSITEANQTIDEILALQPQFQTVLDETTGKDVISAPEVILARNGKINLKTRLDEDHEQVTAQLAQKATKGEITSGDLDISSDGYKIKLINLADEVQQALTGDAPALSVIPYKSITKEKLGFTKIVSRNMFNKLTVTAGKKINRTTGILVDDVNYYTSDFIEVDINTEYIINSAYDGAYFDSSFNYVSGLQPTTAGAFYVFTTPSNVRYLKTSLHKTVLDKLQMEIGNVRTAYEPYLSLIDGDEVEGVNDLKASVNDLKASDSDFGNALNLTSDIKNTNQSVTFNPDGTVKKITHTDKTTSEIVRDDIFTHTTNLITEVRTLPNSATITYKYHLDTMKTEVI